MRMRVSSNDEGLAHAAELENAINFLIMDTSIAVTPEEMAAYVPEAMEAESSGEQTMMTKMPSNGDFTRESNSVFVDRSSAMLESCDSGDSLVYIENRSHSVGLQDPVHEKLVMAAANLSGPSLLSEIENFIAQDSRHMESVTPQFQSQGPIIETHSVAALFMHHAAIPDDDQSLYLPEQMNPSSMTLMSYKPTPIHQLNKINVERTKAEYLTREFVPSLHEGFEGESQAVVGQLKSSVAGQSPPIPTPRKDVQLWLPRKSISNCCREDDDDGHSSSTSSTSTSSSSSSTNSSSSGNRSIGGSRRNVIESDRAADDRDSTEYHDRRHRGRVASKSLSTRQDSCTSQDEDDGASDASERRRKSRRVERSNVQKIAGRFVVRLKGTKNSVDPPKRPTLPKAMTTRVAKLSRRSVIVKGPSLTFPDVTFHEGDDQDDEVSYHKRLDLVALKTLVPQVHLASSAVGKLLKQYSQKEESYFIDVHKISNYKTDLISYPLVYGAVPRAYSFAAKYFINKCLHLLNVTTRKTASTASLPNMAEGEKGTLRKKRTSHEVVTLHDGEIEIITYCYWQLSTQDLIKWHDDVPRRRVKQILEYAWVSMRDSVSKAHKRDNGKKSNLTGVKNALELIRKYAEFDKPSRLTAACLFMIKQNYAVIIHACRDLNLDPLIWESMLRLCGVHHYLCSHTLAEIARRMPQVSKVLKYRLLEIEAQTNDYVVQPMSCKAVFKMFGRWITRPGHVTAKLQQATNNLFFAECRGFGLHVVRFGIWRSDVIYAEHVAGYADIRKTAMQVLELPPLSNINVKRAISLVNDTVNSAVANCGGRMHRLKISIGAIKEFEKYLLYRFSSAIIGVTQCRPQSTTSREWADLFVEAIEDFIDASSKDVHHIDEWSLTDDRDLDEYDDYGIFKRSFAQRYHELFGDSESDSDYDTTYEEDLHDEIRELHREYPDLIGKTRTRPAAISHATKKSAKRPRLVRTEMPYKFSDEKISRVKCVLCSAMTTAQTVILETGMRVACCVACHFVLNTDPAVDIEVLKRRVREKVKAPIGFTADGGIRTFRDLLDETVKTRLSYNRDVMQIGPKLQSAEKLSGSSDSRKRQYIKHHVDAMTKRSEKN